MGVGRPLNRSTRALLLAETPPRLRRASGALFALAVVALCAGRADAHQLHAEAQVEGGEVTLEVYFSDGTPPAGAEVRVLRLGADGEADLQVEAGITDATGTFRYRITRAGRYRFVTIELGLHRATVEVVVSPSDLRAEPGAADPSRANADVEESQVASVKSADVAGGRHLPHPRGEIPFGRVAVGLVIILALAAGLSWARRRSS